MLWIRNLLRPPSRKTRPADARARPRRPLLEALEDRCVPADLSLVSVGLPAGTPADGGSTIRSNDGLAVSRVSSADGRYVVFTSAAENLVPGQIDNNDNNDIFRFDRQTGEMVLISHTGDGVTTGEFSSENPQISADGTVIAFRSAAPDLVPGFVDNNVGGRDVYRWVGGVVTLVSGAGGSATQGADSGTVDVVISADGTAIAFESDAGNLVANFVNNNGGQNDIYLWSAGTLTLVSGAGGSATQGGNDGSRDVVINGDGSVLAFQSSATDLVAGYTGSGNQLYRRSGGAISLVSSAAGSATQGADAVSRDPVISDDGAAIAFASEATDLVAGFANNNGGSQDVFRWFNGTVTLVSGAGGSATQGGGGNSADPALSGDGTTVAFESGATDLVPGFVNNNTGSPDVYRWKGGVLTLISGQGGSATQGGNSTSEDAVVSGNGEAIAFKSAATDLVTGFVNNNDTSTDVYLWSGGALLLASGAGGSPTAGGSDSSDQVAISRSGTVVFESVATDLVAGDTNGVVDVFAFVDLPPTVLVVDNTGDGDDGNYTAGQLTLREAIFLANQNADANTITFDATVFASPQTISLANGPLSIITDLTIVGTGQTIDGIDTTRHLLIGVTPTETFTPTVRVSGLNFVDGFTGDESGGSILLVGGSLEVTGSTFAGNVAAFGGGAISVANTATLTVGRSTFVANRTTQTGAFGGAISSNGTTIVTGSTFVGNRALDGGAIDVDGGTFVLQGSVVAGNTLLDGTTPSDIRGTLGGASRFNLIGDADSAGGLTRGFGNNLVGVDPLLGPLGDYGGFVRTVPLLPGSPAIDAGAFDDGIDARGVAIVGTAIDIGAFESQKFVLSIVGGNNQVTPVDAAFAQPLTVKVTANIAAEPVAGGRVVFDSPDSNTTINFPGDLAQILAPIGADGTASTTGTAVGVPGAFVVPALARGAASVQFSLAIVETPPAALIVDNTGDVSDGDFSAGQQTLREAIERANSDPDANTITFDATVFGTPKTITLVGGQFTLSEDVTITGPGADRLTLDANQLSRHFTVSTGVTAEISGITFVNGKLGANEDGGSIESAGTLTIRDSVFSGNSAEDGGALSNDGVMFVIRSTLRGNAADAGDGIGGAIINNGTLSVTASALLDNTASFGGAFYNNGSAEVNSTTFAGNSSAEQGGAIASDATGPLVIRGSTIVGNRSDSDGSGGELGGGIINYIDTLSLIDTILFGNVTGMPGADAPSDLVHDGGSLAADSSNNLIGIDPLLAPLGDYGGGVLTFALLPGSPAIDAGTGTGPDARGRPVFGAARDLGGFESQGFAAAPAGGAAQAAAPGGAFGQPLTVRVTANDPREPVAGGVVTFSAPAAGPSATLSATRVTLTADGTASVTATANGVAGDYAVTAAVGPAGAPATFALTNGVDAPPPPPPAPVTPPAPTPDSPPVTPPADGPVTNFTPLRIDAVSFTLTQYTLATFEAPPGLASSFTATIDWGDGTTTLGEVVETAPGVYAVLGRHAYANVGQANVTVALRRDGVPLDPVSAPAVWGYSRLPDGSTPTDIDRFVLALYGQLLGRAVSAEEVQAGFFGYWVGLLQARNADGSPVNTREEVVALFAAQPERLRVVVHDLFQRHLGRDADDVGLAFFTALLQAGTSVDRVEALILASDENLAGADALDALYRDVFGRSVDPTGRAVWGARLTGGASPADIALALVTSDEAHSRYLDGVYADVLGRPTDPAADFWLAELGRGGDREEVLAGIVGDSVFGEFYDRVTR